MKRELVMLVAAGLIVSPLACSGDDNEPVDLLYISDSGGANVAERYAELAAEGLDREVRLNREVDANPQGIRTRFAEEVAGADAPPPPHVPRSGGRQDGLRGAVGPGLGGAPRGRARAWDCTPAAVAAILRRSDSSCRGSPAAQRSALACALACAVDTTDAAREGARARRAARRPQPTSCDAP